MVNSICKITILWIFISIYPVYAQISVFYPGDVGIETNPYVIYVEKFDDGLNYILNRYTDIQNSAGMFLDTDVPPGSPGPYSLKITSKNGVNIGGHLFKRFSTGIDSTIYIRYYVKYPSLSNGFFHHEGLWFGGYNPATNWPNPQAGMCGLGNSRLSIAFEPVWQQTNPPGLDTYNYWGDMQSWNGGNSCYGNVMVTRADTAYGQAPVTGKYPTVDFDNWMCIEVMLKLNNPSTAYNGELAVWVNGSLIGHWGPGFPRGHWLKDKWYNNPADSPFQGFRWRTDPKLNINWIWFEFYHDNPNAPSSYIKFDHMVMAKKYIGPISDITGIVHKKENNSGIKVFPNPVTGLFSLTGLTEKSEITLISGKGEILFSFNSDNSFLKMDLSCYPKGLYILKINTAKEVYTHKIVLK